MRTTMTLWIGITAIALVGFSATAMAQEGGPYPGRGPGKRLAALDLSPQQKQQIDKLRGAALEESKPLRAQMTKKMEELRELWRADRPDKALIKTKQNELDAIRDRQRDVWTELRLQVHALLTPEQRIKWADQSGPGVGWRGHGMRGGGAVGGGPSHCGANDCPMRTY